VKKTTFEQVKGSVLDKGGREQKPILVEFPLEPNQSVHDFYWSSTSSSAGALTISHWWVATIRTDHGEDLNVAG
jgi:hypothetical protein